MLPYCINIVTDFTENPENFVKYPIKLLKNRPL